MIIKMCVGLFFLKDDISRFYMKIIVIKALIFFTRFFSYDSFHERVMKPIKILHFNFSPMDVLILPLVICLIAG
ncbi:hypothetical protein MEE_01603 [Bartonella elizabethae F9251 = ATCC 49927]|uniref:Uncharacterized protein n=1 Tax=Bartonella elizabethae F9251 = ATCC 49927 TaxID=1094555 RepID=J0R926_BAREL|nr:hypothetical protein MEE_01603 [Bartonella elizabethae F9251 = ATCC 49927]